MSTVRPLKQLFAKLIMNSLLRKMCNNYRSTGHQNQMQVQSSAHVPLKYHYFSFYSGKTLMRLSHLSLSLKLWRSANRAFSFVCSAVFRWISSVHRLNLELRFVGFRKSVPPRVLCLQPSLKCWTDRYNHHHGRLFDYLLTSWSVLRSLPYTSDNWPWISMLEIFQV